MLMATGAHAVKRYSSIKHLSVESPVHGRVISAGFAAHSMALAVMTIPRLAEEQMVAFLARVLLRVHREGQA